MSHKSPAGIRATECLGPVAAVKPAPGARPPTATGAAQHVGLGEHEAKAVRRIVAEFHAKTEAATT